MKRVAGRSLLSAATVLLSVLTVRAADINLGVGENELSDEMNSSDNRLIAASGSVLKLTGAATDGVYTINCKITAEAGELVIDATEVTDLAALRMTANLGSAGKGSVKIKGVDRLTFGTATTPSYDWGMTWGAFAALDTELTFVDESDVAYASPAVTFVNGVLLAVKPSYAYSIADGAVIAPFGTDALGDKIANGVLEASTWDVFLIKPAGLPTGTKVRVGAGRSIFFRPCTLNVPEYRWGGTSCGPFELDIELGEGAKFLSGDNNNVNTVKGTVSGSGSINLMNTSGLTLDGEQTFEGAVVLDWNGTSTRAAGGNFITFKSSSPGADTNSIQIVKGSILSDVYCQPAGYGTEPTTFTMGDFISSDGAQPVTLHTYAQETVFMQTLTGKLYLEGAGTVSIARLGEDAKVYVPSGMKLIVGEKAPTAKIYLTKGPNGSCDWSVAGPASGSALEPHLSYPDDLVAYTLTLGGALTISEQQPAGCSVLTIEKDAQVRLVANSAGTTVRNLGGSLVLLGPGEGWRGKVGLWVDAAKTESIVLAEDFLPKGTATESPFAGDEVGAWMDCRGQSDYCFAQLRYTKWSEVTYTSIIPVYVQDPEPAYVWTRENGNCRLNMGKISGTGRTYSSVKESSMPAKHVLMVFNGTDGGGAALISEESGVFERTVGRAKGIVKGVDATARYLISTNGVELADPTTTPLSGGWQIISLAVRDQGESVTENRTLRINGLGGFKTGSDSSGMQRYGEVLVFDQEPSVSELLCAETYLANKWGLPLQTNEAAEVQVRVAMKGDTGAYAFNSDAQLTGHFKGTLNLNGNQVTIQDGTLPYTESDIPAEGRLLWNDPSLADAIKFSTNETRLLEVWGVYPRNNAGLDLTNGSLCLLGVSRPDGSSDYRPWFSQSARVFGCAEGWLDYSKRFSSGTDHELLFTKYPIDETIITLDGGRGFETLTTVRDAFLVLDSSNGGGTIFNSKAGGSDFKPRAHNGGTLADPIWSDACSAVVKEAETRLDGEIVNAANGFTGKPEVLSVFPESDTVIKGLGSGFNEAFGEVLLYSTPHTAEVRRGIESYLMLKWLGRMPAGYTDFRDATVTGAGKLVAPTAKHLPTLGPGFTGAVELGGFGEAFVLDGEGAAKNAVSFSGFSVKDGIVNIKVTRYASGAHLLASGLAEGSSVSLGSVEGFDATRVRVRLENGDVYADLIPRGMMYILR